VVASRAVVVSRAAVAAATAVAQQARPRASAAADPNLGNRKALATRAFLF
jgi:hypothetical protein